ncbi:MAG: ubiquitin-like protein Pup [Actinomycetes bacterium]
MSERIQRQRVGTSQPQEDAPVVAPHLRAEALDDLLDEIDSVLESDAEEYVKGFVQKGGQ